MQPKWISHLLTIGSMVSLLVAGLVMLPSPAVAQASDDEAQVRQMQQIHTRLQENARLAQVAEETGDRDVALQARAQMREAERQMNQVMAKVAGVKENDIAAMRTASMSYGQICRELGMDPGLLGEGHRGTATQNQVQSRTATQNRESIRNQEETPQLQTRDRQRSRVQNQLQDQSLDPDRVQARDRARRNIENDEATRRQTRAADAPKHGMSAVGQGSAGMGLGQAGHQHANQHQRGFAGTRDSGGSMAGSGSGGPGGSGSGGPGGSGSGGPGGSGSGGPGGGGSGGPGGGGSGGPGGGGSGGPGGGGSGGPGGGGSGGPGGGGSGSGGSGGSGGR